MAQTNPTNFARWFEAYGAKLTLYARQWLSVAEAEDAVQEVFVRLMNRDCAPDNVAAWLFAAVRNQAISMHRLRSSRQRREQIVAERQSAYFEPDSMNPIDATAAEAALSSLPDSQREVVVLRIWGAMSFSRIAAVTGSAISTVHDQYKLGLAGIRKRMESPCRAKTSKMI